jgi:hypothetical protein
MIQIQKERKAIMTILNVDYDLIYGFAIGVEYVPEEITEGNPVVIIELGIFRWVIELGLSH